MTPINGVVTGIVRDLNDPEGEGRILLEFPWLEENYRSMWAPIARPLAGGGRGMYFMPEVDDEVLAAFDHGDVNHPFVIGFLWNGVDQPPDQDINYSVRRLRTVSGHVIEFDDNSGKEAIRITTQGGHTIELTDSPLGSIQIKTSGGQELKMEDAPLPKITLKTAAGTGLEMTDLQVNINASTSSLTITALQASLSATGVLTINAPLTLINGVVQATTVISQAVVSATYSPGVGNIW